MDDKSNDKPRTLGDAIKDMANAIREKGGKVWDEIAPVMEHGKTEIAHALFHGGPYAFNMETEKDAQPDPGKEMEQER